MCLCFSLSAPLCVSVCLCVCPGALCELILDAEPPTVMHTALIITIHHNVQIVGSPPIHTQHVSQGPSCRCAVILSCWKNCSLFSNLPLSQIILIIIFRNVPTALIVTGQIWGSSGTSFGTRAVQIIPVMQCYPKTVYVFVPSKVPTVLGESKEMDWFGRELKASKNMDQSWVSNISL